MNPDIDDFDAVKEIGAITEDREPIIVEQHDPQNKTKEQFEKDLTEKYHFKAMKDNDELFYYDTRKGIYVKDAQWLVKQEAIDFLVNKKTSEVNDILNRITWSNYTDRESFDPDIDWLCFKNVMVNIRTGEAREHSPDFMATIQIPQVYVNLSKTPHIPTPQKILKFLHEVTGDPEAVETILDYIAYCLYRGFPFHKLLLFNGSGRNGKTVTTEIIKRFLGRNNVSSETLGRILDNNYATANLYGKLANIDADLSNQALSQTGILKKLTGNDSIIAEFKFRQAFDFQNYAKLIFSTNQIPVTPDESDAFFARFLIVNFPNQYLGAKANPYLIDELTTPEEMSSLLSLVLKRLPRVLKDGISSKNTIEDTYEKYMQSSNPIRLFTESVIIKTNNDDDYETKESVYNAYERFCTDKKLPKESSYTFSRRLTDEGFDHKQKKIDGVRTVVWVKMKLIDYKQAEAEQEILDL